MALLGGFFLGSIFGFYWGKTQRTETAAGSFEDADAKMNLLLRQIQDIYDAVKPIPPPNEIIEPIEPETELEQLFPERTV